MRLSEPALPGLSELPRIALLAHLLAPDLFCLALPARLRLAPLPAPLPLRLLFLGRRGGRSLSHAEHRRWWWSLCGLIISERLVDEVEAVVFMDGVVHEDLLVHVVKEDVNRCLLLGGGCGRGANDDHVQLGGLAEEVVMAGREGVALALEREVGVVGMREGKGVGRGVEWQGPRGK